jgi:hypothetical protein
MMVACFAQTATRVLLCQHLNFKNVIQTTLTIQFYENKLYLSCFEQIASIANVVMGSGIRQIIFWDSLQKEYTYVEATEKKS